MIVTLTAPSFGRVHTIRDRDGLCACIAATRRRIPSSGRRSIPTRTDTRTRSSGTTSRPDSGNARRKPSAEALHASSGFLVGTEKASKRPLREGRRVPAARRRSFPRRHPRRRAGRPSQQSSGCDHVPASRADRDRRGQEHVGRPLDRKGEREPPGGAGSSKSRVSNEEPSRRRPATSPSTRRRRRRPPPAAS